MDPVYSPIWIYFVTGKCGFGKVEVGGVFGQGGVGRI